MIGDFQKFFSCQNLSKTKSSLLLKEKPILERRHLNSSYCFNGLPIGQFDVKDMSVNLQDFCFCFCIVDFQSVNLACFMLLKY